MSTTKRTPVYDASGYDVYRSIYNEPELSLHSISTLSDDKKIRFQYISFLKATKKLQEDYMDEAFTAYFSSIISQAATASSMNDDDKMAVDDDSAIDDTEVLNELAIEDTGVQHTFAATPTNNTAAASSSPPSPPATAAATDVAAHAPDPVLPARSSSSSTQTIRKLEETITTVTMDSQGQLSFVTERKDRSDLLHSESSPVVSNYLSLVKVILTKLAPSTVLVRRLLAPS